MLRNRLLQGRIWRLMTRQDLNNLGRLCSELEASHIHFFSVLYDQIRHDFSFPPEYRVYLHGDPTRKELCSAVAISKYGRILPVFYKMEERDIVKDLFSKKLGIITPKNLTILGISKQADYFMQHISPHRIRMEYYLMEWRLCDFYKTAEIILPTGMSFHIAKPENIDILFHLELGYQREEVLLQPKNINLKLLFNRFRRQLEKFIIVYISYSGVAIAKAGINLYGKDYVQLGGIYTAPEWRGQGLGTIVVRRLLAELSKLQRSCVLFVKKDNLSAQHIYKNNNFRVIEDLSIIYAESN